MGRKSKSKRSPHKRRDKTQRLRKVKRLIPVGYKKVRGIVSALNGGLCKVLITDEHTATLAFEEICAREKQ